MNIRGIQFACPDCFAHPWLRNHVAQNVVRRGTCPGCGHRNRPLAPISALFEPFKNLVGIYVQADGEPLGFGTPILDLIQSDWDVFSLRLWEREGAGALFEAIMMWGWDDDDGEPVFDSRAHYVRYPWNDPSLEALWQEFLDEVMVDPDRPLRFRGLEWDELLFQQEIRGLQAVQLAAATTCYRARLGCDRMGTEHRPYRGSDMGAPPREKAGAGRADIEGQPVLYCADQRSTAIAEVRPALGEYVSVAELHLRTEVQILDLTRQPEPLNPFQHDHLRHLIDVYGLIWALGRQLGKPIRSRQDSSEYLPSRRIAAVIEKSGLAGIRYPSSLSNGGTNLVLFDPSVVVVGLSTLVEITGLQVTSQEV